MKPLKMVVSKRIMYVFVFFFSGSFLRFSCLFSGGDVCLKIKDPKKSPSINSRLGTSMISQPKWANKNTEGGDLK